MKTLRIQKENATFQVLKAIKTNRQKRAKRGEIFVEGVAAINAAAASGIPSASVVHSEDRRLSDWAHDMIDRLNPDTRLILSDRLMAEISDRTDPSELIVVFKRPTPTLQDIKISPAPFVVILDRPSNTGNLGSLVRSCDAFGVDAVITTGHGVDIYDPQVIRASLGGIFHLQLIHEPSSAEIMSWLDRLKNDVNDLEIIGTDSDGADSLRDKELRKPTAVLFGNEATGLSVALREYVDRIVAIPIDGAVNSLNLACAASIILYSVK
jgi:23S rRNA (uridine2479-2'-O)-methyltransferase